MKYTKPNFDEEWMEALRYREFEKMGKEGWLKVASQNYDITNYEKIKDVLNNTDLDYESLDKDKRKRFEDAFKKGKVEIPIAVKFAENDYDLLGGNTRLAGLIKNGINPKLWVIDLSQKEEMNEKWSKKYKDSIDCNNPKGFSQKAHCQGRKKNIRETEELKGGLADNKTLIQIAKKHDAKGYYHIQDMVKSLKKQLEMGVKVEMEHTNSREKAHEIAMDHLWEDPSYYTKLKKIEAKEMTGADAAGAYSAPAFSTVIKKKEITKIHNMMEQEQEIDEVTDASSSGSYDVPLFGGTKGRKNNPLSIGGPDTIYKGRAVKDKKFPKWGGPGGKFVKIKDKCKKFPYCNQGDISALELMETEEMMSAINEIAIKYGLPASEVEKLVLNQIKQIFI